MKVNVVKNIIDWENGIRVPIVERHIEKEGNVTIAVSVDQ